MQILIAEDDAVSRIVLERTLRAEGYDVVVTSDGGAAWNVLQRDDAPRLAILDWMMPEIDGIELCRMARQLNRAEPTYIILLTAKHQTEDVVTGLESGANDYLTKPFDRRELRSRIRVGERVVTLQHQLAQRIGELESALTQVNLLHGLLPICCYCKSIRTNENYWQQVESYLAEHAEVRFSHGVCPGCYEQFVERELAEFERQQAGTPS